MVRLRILCGALILWIIGINVNRCWCKDIRTRQIVSASADVYEDFVVHEYGELLIEPGVVLRFAPGVGIEVLTGGVLKAVGNATHRITLTSLRKEAQWSDPQVGRSSPVLQAPISTRWPDVRLVDGDTIHDGRLQVFFKNNWWSVCTDSKNWTEEDLQVVCQQLGFTGGHQTWWFGRNDSRQLMYSSPNCTGNETDLTTCPGWDDRKRGSGICNFHMDIGIQCKPFLQEQAGSNWKGIVFRHAKHSSATVPPGVRREISESQLQRVTITYAGRTRDGQAISAIHVEGLPPVMDQVDVKWSSYNGMNVTTIVDAFDISNSQFIENRGYGIFVNSSKGLVKLKNVTAQGNGADGIHFVYNEYPVNGRSRFCTDSENTQYPQIHTHTQTRQQRIISCSKSFRLDRSFRENKVITIHFKNMKRDDDPDRYPEKGVIEVYDDVLPNRKNLLGRFIIRNDTRPQSFSTYRDVLTVIYIPVEEAELTFTVEAMADYDKAYDLNCTDCTIMDNNGRGIWIRNPIVGVAVNRSSITGNTHIAGLHVDGGVGDVVVNSTTISNNIGDGINASYAGGHRHIDRSSISNNSLRGVAFWFNETSDKIPFLFSTHVSYTTVNSNGGFGVLLGNSCRSDAFWNISMNTFFQNGDAAVQYMSCWKKPTGNDDNMDTLYITNNIFRDTRHLSVSVSPALHVRALINYNNFYNHESSALFVANPEMYEYADIRTEVEIKSNWFHDNKGWYVANIGVVQDSNKQNAIFTRNYLNGNTVSEPFTSLKPRSRVSAVVVVTSSNALVTRNLFTNPDSNYELGSHLENSGKTINATLNYWGYGNDEALRIYTRIFDRKDRFNLAEIRFLPFLTGTDLNSTRDISTAVERDAVMKFENGNEIGGEVPGRIELQPGDYRVIRDIYIRPLSGSQLKIHPGVRLMFENSVGMMVQGRLDCSGEDERKITFTSSSGSSVQNEIGNLRLSNGLEGRIEALVNGQWGSVCSYGFDMEDAALICHQLGSALNPRDWLLERSEMDDRDVPAVLSNVQCKPTDTDFLQCKSEKFDIDFEGSCALSVGIRCYPNSWSGLRFGIHAEGSILKNSIIEKAGLFDYATHQFKPAVQLDMNHHHLEKLIVRENHDVGIGIMWNDIFYEKNAQTISYSDLSTNRYHGLATRSQGLTLTNNKMLNNKGSGINYDPMFTRLEQRELIQTISGDIIRFPEAISEGETLRLDLKKPKYLVVSSTSARSNRRFKLETDPRNAIGLMVLNPIEEHSSESLIFYKGHNTANTDSESIWDVHKNLTAFPIREAGYAVTVSYNSGDSPRGTAVVLITAVDPLGTNLQRIKYMPIIQIEGNEISRCHRGFSSSHYNRDISEFKDVYHRYSNETIYLVNNTITDNAQEAVYVSTPNWDPKRTSLAEVNYTLVRNVIQHNAGGIVQYSRDIRSSNNLFHWVINETEFSNNYGGVDIRLPYVWQYDENYTHSVSMYQNRFSKNYFSLNVDGHFSRFNLSYNKFYDNTCKLGLVAVKGMEKEMLIEENEFTDNVCKYVIEFNLESHSEKFSIVDANFRRNLLKSNRPNETLIDDYGPSSYTISMRGVQQINITRNIISNPSMHYEFLAGVYTSSIKNELNVAENWWGSVNGSLIKNRIFDFDDWNNYAIANFQPYLSRETVDAGTLSEFSEGKYIDLDKPFGGRLKTSLTLYRRNTPYVIKSDLTVLPDTTLTIMEGVEIEFYPSVGILVLGDIKALGRPWAPIEMRPVKRSQFTTRLRRQTTLDRSVRLCVDKACQESRRDGFLEYYNRTTLQWVPVCDPRFTERNAEVVCAELGYSRLNAVMRRGVRYDMGYNELSLVQSWPHPLECIGDEERLEDCEFRLNGYGQHDYGCSPMSEFLFLYCGEENRREDEEYWGGIRIAVSDYEPIKRTKSYYGDFVPPVSYIRNTIIRGAGILHHKKTSAIQAVLRDVTLDDLNITECISHGIEILASPGYQYISRVNVTNNVGNGINVLTLNGQTSDKRELDYSPLKMVDIPYNIFGMVDICDTNKEFIFQGRVLLYYKYDNRPVDCVKIFISKDNGKEIGFRLLQFNLFNATSYSPQPDNILLFDGDIFNESIPILGNIQVETPPSDDKSQRLFYRSTFSTMSVLLHATGGSGLNGFIAEVVTVPYTDGAGRKSKHNITSSYFHQNQMGAIAYHSAGEITPIISLLKNRIDTNGLSLFGNFTTSDSAVHLDVQNCMEMFIINNNFIRNQGGLHIQASSFSYVSALKAFVRNNLFTENRNREVLLMQSKDGGSFQDGFVFQNYFSRNDGDYRDNVLLSKINFNFSKNLLVGNRGRHQMTVVGFDKQLSSTQMCLDNWFWNNDATFLETKSTIFATAAGQKYHRNYFWNVANFYEMASDNRTDLENINQGINAKNNWWGFGVQSAISGRIFDYNDEISRLNIDEEPFLPTNESVISGNCAGGWEKIGDTCFLYVPAAMGYEEAKRFCQLDSSSMPYTKQRFTQIQNYVTSQQPDYDWDYEYLWVQSFDVPIDECAVLHRGRVENHDCNDRLPFLCERAQEINVSFVYWYQEPISIIAMAVITSLVFCVSLFICFWFCKSQQRHKDHLERRNSIRASIRSNRSTDVFAELGYKRRLDKVLKEPQPKIVEMKGNNGSIESFDKNNTASRYSYSIDDSQIYDVAEVKNPVLDYSNEMEDKFAGDPQLENSNVNMIVHPTFDLTYENRGYIDRSMSRDSPDESRDWSSVTDSTLDMKRTLDVSNGDMGIKEQTYRSSPTLRSSQDTYSNHSSNNSSNYSNRRPLETAM